MPWAMVTVDDGAAQRTPHDFALAPGSHTVRAQYTEWRRFDAAATAMAVDLIDRVFSNDNAVLKPLRGLALMAANTIAPLRRAMARQASADQDHMPSLMR
jgi:2-octaprenyl-6-methoxyphenol hydroxylase